tara:strand:- start:704 stop:1537 length:834 start_codon:yes stop_codon:yes gene_type:complete
MTKEEKRNAINKKYYEKNKEKIAARNKKYYEKNKEKRNAYLKSYREANREKAAANAKVYREDNKEKRAANAKVYREANKEEIAAKAKVHYKANKEEIAVYAKVYREDNKEKRAANAKVYREANKEKLKAKAKAYNEDNKEEIRANQNKIERNRRRTDPVYKMKSSIRSNVLQSFKRKGFTKDSRTFEILGCDYDTFIKHITDKFTDGMSLESHGEWHLDHQIPLALAETEEEVVELCHYTNYQPLWAKDNLEKNDKVRLENISFTNKVKYIKFLNRI